MGNEVGSMCACYDGEAEAKVVEAGLSKGAPVPRFPGQERRWLTKAARSTSPSRYEWRSPQR